MKKIEPDNIYLLRHRWARSIEVRAAYQTFLNREVLVGSDKTCLNDEVVTQTTHTLLVAYYSFIYSLFDPSGTNFEYITCAHINDFPEKVVEVRDLILEHWQKIEDPIRRIRHNIGFHQSKKRKGSSNGYESYRELHPLSADYIMTLFRVFFRLLDDVYDYEESYMFKPNKDETDVLYDMALQLKRSIDESPQENLMKVAEELFNKLLEENKDETDVLYDMALQLKRSIAKVEIA
jgi:hypothetical protein